MAASQPEWQPHGEQLQQLAQVLRDSLSGRDQNLQRSAEMMIRQAKTSPDIDNYLCFLLVRSTTQNVNLSQDGLHSARSAAGIMLKNDIKTNYKSISQSTLSYIRTYIIAGLQDSNAQIRNFAGNVITELVHQAGVMAWPDLLSELASMAANDTGSISPQGQEGAMSALLKVCEDNRRAIEKVYQGQCPLTYLVPRLLKSTSSQSAKIRANAIASLTIFIPDRHEAIMSNLDDLLSQLFNLATDPSDDVRKHICRAILRIGEVSPGLIVPHMEGLATYMVTQQRNVDDPELALDAAEFWLSAAEQKDLRSALGPHLSNIIPVLLESMVYSEDDVLRLEAEAEDAEAEDRESDIKPQFATAKAGRNMNGGILIESASTVTFDSADLSDGELEEYDEEDIEDDPESQWNLRKCSAAALDVLAVHYPQAVFEIILPYLKENLTHSDWPQRESAVLAIGAVAEGCLGTIEPHLRELIPFLINLLQDKTPVVRQITCWSLGRYSGWASHLDPAGKDQVFLPMMDGILKQMLDNNKRVQEAAASAFANLEERANKQLDDIRYCGVIARQFAQCFAKYKDKNMFILYDCVQTLAEHVGSTLAEPELVHQLMPALLGRWEKVPDQSREMFPLLECLSYIATALGDSFAPYAPPIFHRCNTIIYSNLQESLLAADNDDLDEPESDFLVTSLDLLSAVMQSLGTEKSTQLVVDSSPNMFELLIFCLENPNNEVRQSAFALLGDCSIFVFNALRPALAQVIPVLVKQLDVQGITTDAEEAAFAVTNNACWSCGEIAMRAGSDMSPFVETVLQQLYTILTSTKTPRSLHENASIALGRLGNGCATVLAPHVGTFAPIFLQDMNGIDWTDEKAQAMSGMSKVILLNPQGLEQCLLAYINEIAGREVPMQDHDLFQDVITMYKGLVPNFPSMLQNLPADRVQNLQKMYTI